MIAAKTKLFEHVVFMSSYGVIYLHIIILLFGGTALF